MASRTNYQQSGYIYEKAPAEAKLESLEPLQEQATVMLDRVKVMRVFDLAGVIEAISEARELCERRNYCGQERGNVVTCVQRSEEVANSEDEEEEVSISDAVRELGPEKELVSADGSLVMIVVDNITNVVSATMSKNQTEGLKSFS